ncbi:MULTISPECIES: UDP-glucose 4-epimerase GalE [unclassified Acidisoma]|jgi:UDP-glucose 4-epimerase|uniref:UDP-glucose 4-epimerase GalE n=1 Tax=unclassified Acidisoma TaxID=2634065 RepID=UPI00131E7349|nr:MULTISPECIES: UDP-glucose 4-epimerase GalE [unclassified Acidisoma]
MNGRAFLVTGGAGYVGSHLVAHLADQGAEVVVLDNLRQGHAAAVPHGIRLVVGEAGDPSTLEEVFSRTRFDAVFHFASLSLVGESMQQPFRYLEENSLQALRLIEAACRHQVMRFVLSSTANLFAAPERLPIDESEAIDPGSPYGESKYIIERALVWADRIFGLRSAALRYFNAAGADPEGRLGEDHDPETHLIPLLIDAALGRRPPITVFGSDYDTPDGTCIRDYVHVSDLATAHSAVLDLLETRSATFNLGSGHGHSVREVIAAVERVSGRAVPLVEGGRRAGDPPALVASAAALQRDTGWAPRFTDLDEIVATAYRWRLDHPEGYAE